MLVEDELKKTSAILIQDAFRGLLATLFYLVPSATHDVVIYGREHVSGHHPTMIISNHKRDLDSLVLIGITYFARGISRPNRMLAFSLREDVFWAGFLDKYLRWPWPFAPLLRAINTRSHMHLLKAYPIGHLGSREQAAPVRAQLARFAYLLDHGRDLYWAPEGGLTLDGQLSRFRAGFYRVIRDSHAPLRLLPVAIFYDFMTTLRTRCFIRIGPEIDADRSLSRAELERQARLAILRQMTINAGHLGVAVLRSLAQDAHFHREDMDRLMLEQARRFRSAGLTLDPRLTVGASFRRRVRQLLGYWRREGILEEANGEWSLGLGMRHRQMQYVLNELREVEKSLAL